MKFLGSSLAVLFLSVVGFGQMTTHTSFFDGKKFTYEFSAETLKSTTSWNPEHGTPPIALVDLIKSARNGLKRFVPNADSKWVVEGIDLSKVGWEAEKWYYEVKFQQYLDGRSGDSFAVFVRLDGTVVDPVVTEDTEPPNVKSRQMKVGTPKPR